MENIQIEYFISMYLDTRRIKKNGKYPVKLRVFTPTPRKQKLYPTKFELTEKEFQSIWETSKPRKEHKEYRMKMQSVEQKAEEVASDLETFSFEQFEKKLYRKKSEAISIKYNYDQKINELKEAGKVNTASNYDLSLKSIKAYCESKPKGKLESLTFLDISKKWLQGYEKFMVDNDKSLTTVSIYVRCLRALYKVAIADKEISDELYPFGEKKYQIPNVSNKKKALNLQQLKILHLAKPKNKEQMKAKAFWFFSYNCSGMNMKDILLLKAEDVQNDKVEFFRAKTKTTSRKKLKPITVHLNQFAKDHIKRYGTKKAKGKDLVFPVLKGIKDPLKVHHAIKNFTRFVNQHIKELCKDNGLPEISSYWARHSWATNAIRKGASMEFVQEGLGHNDLKTTMNYFAGFEDETKKEFAESLMNFD